MPHVDTIAMQATRARPPRRRVDPVLWVWIVVALMALLPLKAALAG